jgi:Pyridoxamine 5'-phosphate oxidase
MATWRQFEDEAGELAADVRRAFGRGPAHVLATLRRDGAPRVSGIEVQFDGADMTIGSMPGAVKARDLLADGRFALHAMPGEDGDAKVSGVAIEVSAGARREDGARFFRLDLRQAVCTAVSDDRTCLLIRAWRPGQGVERIERY